MRNLLDKTLTNEELVPLAIGGNQDAYAELYERLKPRISRLAWRMFQSSVDNEDFQSDALSKILMSLDKFHHGSLLTTWATRVAINHGLMIMRKKRLLIDRTDSLDTPIADAGGSLTLGHTLADPRDAFAAMESGMDVVRLVSSLPVGYRRVILAYYMDGMKLDEITELFDIPLGAAKSIKFRGLRLARSKAESKPCQF